MKYLGVPVTFSHLKIIDWDFLDAKLIKKLEAWICDSASSGARLTLIQSSHEPRVINWSLTANRRFTTLSVYQMLERNISRAHNKGIWKSKLPLKIKIILWQLHQDVNCVNKR
jgi:hypothetical protein